METIAAHKSIVLKTYPQFNKFEITWIVPNFLFRQNYETDYAMLSPKFTVDNGEDKFILQLEAFPNTYSDWVEFIDENATFAMQLNLKRISSPIVKRKASVQLSFLFNNNESNKIVYDQYSTIDPQSDSIASGSLDWELINQHEYFRANRDLTMKLLIRFDNGDLHDENYSFSTLKNMSEQSLINDFKSLLTSSQFSDDKIIVLGKEFPVHKNILVARSTFFRNMYENVENTAEFARFDNVHPETMAELLHYIYTGSVERVESLMNPDLLEAADYFLLDDLNLICTRAITKNLSVVDLPNVLKLVNKRNNFNYLRDSVLRFVAYHRSEVTNMENYDDIMQSLSPTLLSEMVKLTPEQTARAPPVVQLLYVVIFCTFAFKTINIIHCIFFEYTLFCIFYII